MNISTTNSAAIASSKNSSLAQPVQEVATPTDPIAARLRLNNRSRVQEYLVDGEMFWQKRQGFKKLKDYKAWLESQGFIWKNACRYIKLYEVFASFSLDQIGLVDPSTLFQLCQPKYKELLQQLRSFPIWTDAKVQELMQQWRSSFRKLPSASQPQQEKPASPEPATGWRQLPGGGRGYQLPLLHWDWVGTLIERAKKIRSQTLSQLIRDMVVFFVQAGQAPGLSMAEVNLNYPLPITMFSNT